MMQPTPALSSAEAELMAATQSVKQCIFLRDILQFMRYKQENATVIFEDNAACVRLSKNAEFHKHTQHIEIQWFYRRKNI